MNVRLTGSFTLDLLGQSLKRALTKRGHGDWAVQVAPYGQFRQALLREGEGPGVEVLVTDLDAWVPDGAAGLLSLPPPARREAREALTASVRGFAEAAARRGARLLVATLPLPVRPLLGYADWLAEEGEVAWIQTANALLAETLRAFPSARVWDLALLRAAFGVAASADARLRCLGDLRMSASFTDPAAEDLARLLATLVSPSRKVLALDLDGTLWGGLVGEEGLGVEVGPETPVGRAFLSFQRELLALKRRGILLAVVSRNDEAAALEALDRHPGMALRRRDLAAWRINWQDKPSNLRSLAEELGLGMDSFAFWDDQPAERERVLWACPEVAVAPVPGDPAAYADCLRGWEAFDASTVTAEDRARAGQYAAARERQALRAASGSLEDYLRSLDTRVSIRPAAPEDRPRLTQLFQKTSQFNLTTRRLGEPDLMALAEASRILVMRLSDRFGDQGLVGAAVLEPGDRAWRLSDFLLSCRVLGRQAETALLSKCLEAAWAGGAASVVGEYLGTPRNAVARDFYARAGFREEVGGNGLRCFSILRGEGPPFPAWIRLEEAVHGS